MTRTAPLLTGIFSGALLLIILVFAIPAHAESVDYRALIIVSDYNGTDEYELAKAMAFNDYLEGIGYDEDDILFLTDEDVQCRDDDVNVQNVEDGFQWVIDDSKHKTIVNIYVSDNAHTIQTETFYRFDDGQVYCSDIIDWIDQISYDTLNYITLGNHSGLFGPQLVGPNRAIMSSMRDIEESTTDQFNITRSLENSFADTDNDGDVSFVEAFYYEQMLLLGSGQTPQIWLP